MDDGRGRMKQYKSLQAALEAKNRNPIAGGIFHKGQVVEIEGSRFKVTQILRNGLKLALLNRE